ncbi:unnamed protein product [Heligmosomoides polygyrus]|uniref:Uncharacterized protein n=1 Tax=Heligmosomoides polygyrus TaxID=6339 RepID=A0A183FD35_HELPZ|nr:unnamed protein product [Heligmosomoides polygyrus]
MKAKVGREFVPSQGQMAKRPWRTAPSAPFSQRPTSRTLFPVLETSCRAPWGRQVAAAAAICRPTSDPSAGNPLGIELVTSTTFFRRRARAQRTRAVGLMATHVGSKYVWKPVPAVDERQSG